MSSWQKLRVRNTFVERIVADTYDEDGQRVHTLALVVPANLVKSWIDEVQNCFPYFRLLISYDEEPLKSEGTLRTDFRALTSVFCRFHIRHFTSLIPLSSCRRLLEKLWPLGLNKSKEKHPHVSSGSRPSSQCCLYPSFGRPHPGLTGLPTCVQH